MKIIKSFILNTSNLPASGDRRSFSVYGDNNSVFSLEITNEDNHYYNFSTKKFAAAKSSLKNKIIKNRVYNGFIDFPSITDDDHYDIVLTAEQHLNTKHADYKEVRFRDNTIDINSSTGSNSTRLQKIIYQYTDVTLTISATTPNNVSAYSSFTVTTDTISGGRYNKNIKVPFVVKVASASVRAFCKPGNVSDKDIVTSVERQIGSGVKITGENIYDGTARSSDKVVNGDVTSGTSVRMDDDYGSFWAVGDRITGNAALDAKTGDNAVTVTAVNVGSNAKVFTMSEAIAIADDETLTFTPPRYHRWSVTGGVHDLYNGMSVTGSVLDGTRLKDRIVETAIEIEQEDVRYMSEDEIDQQIYNLERVIVDSSRTPSIEPIGDPTLTNGVVTNQGGNICFNKSQFDIAGLNHKFWAYGRQRIKQLTGYDLDFTNLKVELTDSTYVSGTKPTTTTTGTVSNSTSIAVADREGIIQNFSTISGIGIDSSSSNPTITSSQADGAGSWTASAAQTLESGITLTIDNSSRYVVISGDVEIKQFGNANQTVFFNLESILGAK